jgi:nicotinamide-nucleotide amidase
MYDEIFNSQDMLKLQDILRNNKKTITCAESCTGGLIASMITEVSGSSDIFRGSVVTYCNEIKEQELQVKKQTMIEHGVVSTHVVEEMCMGVSKKFAADFSMAVSGVAGPGGGTKDKPVGTVCYAIFYGFEKIKSEKLSLTGSRKEIQIQSAKIILREIFKFIQKTLDKK